MKTPGPHAMTAQAGAVALLDALIAEIRLEARDGTEAGHDMSVQRDWATRIARARKKIATPPAAVSVEALEGLVGRLRKQALSADSIESLIADELTQLIKERSNG